MSTRLNDLRPEYQRLWDSMTIDDNHRYQVDSIVDRILLRRADYEEVANATGLRWEVIACIHSLESSLSFKGHLHNGDPLRGRTVHVPEGRPRSCCPPYDWTESAIDAIKLKLPDEDVEFDIPASLWFMERYNGWGYRRRPQNRDTTPSRRSPYLWSFTNHHQKGKYVADGRFDPNAVSKQAGAAALLARILEQTEDRSIPGGSETTAQFSRYLRRGVEGEDVMDLQSRLRELGHNPGYIDGQFGPRTETAVESFQRSEGIERDGIVGPITWSRLYSAGDDTGGSGDPALSDGKLRERVLAIAVREASKGRKHEPGNEIDRLVLDPFRPALVAAGHLGRSQNDNFFNWCAAWVTYILKQADIAVPFRYDEDYYATLALVDAWRDMARKTGCWHRRGDGYPRPGDVVTFNWDGDSDLDHIGIFKEFGRDSSFASCEGNRGNREVITMRKLNQMDGWIDVVKLASKLG